MNPDQAGPKICLIWVHIVCHICKLKSKCSIFLNVFKYIVFQRRQKAYYGVKG